MTTPAAQRLLGLAAILAAGLPWVPRPGLAQAALGPVLIARVVSAEASGCEAAQGALRLEAVALRVLRGALASRRLALLAPCASAAQATEGALLRVELEAGAAPVLAIAVAPATEADLPAPDVASLLPATRAELEASRQPLGSEDGVVWYADGIGVRYAGDAVAELLFAVPPGLGCSDVPRWLGVRAPWTTAPLRRAGGCRWPGLSPRHVLAPGLVGELSAGVLRVAAGHTASL